MISWSDSKRLHSIKRLLRLLRLVLLRASLQIEAKVSLCVLSLIEKRFKRGVNTLQDLIRRYDCALDNLVIFGIQ